MNPIYKFHVQIGDEKCVIDAETRTQALAKLGYEVTGVYDAGSGKYAVKHDGQFATAVVSAMKGLQEGPESLPENSS
jgi:hypothetical protein